MGIQDPDNLSDDDWAARLKELEYIRQKELDESIKLNKILSKR